MQDQGKFGSYLRGLRAARNLSLRAAAAAIGVSASRLGELENNRSRVTRKETSPGTELVIKLAKFYDQPLGRLLELAGLTGGEASEPEEVELMTRYRRMSARSRELLIVLARTLEDQDARRVE